MEKKQTLLVVDTDQEFANRFAKRLRYNKLDDRYEVVNVVPDTALPVSDIVNDVLGRISQEMTDKDLDVVAFFVDIIVIESGAELDRLGVEIAKQLKERFLNTLTFNVTGKIASNQQLDMFCEAALEESDGVLSKHFLDGEGFNESRLRRILQVRRRHETRKGFPSTEPCGIAILTALHDDEFENVSKQFEWTREVEHQTGIFRIASMKGRDGNDVRIVATHQNRSGIVDAAILATDLINLFSPKYLIMPGVCGGGGKDMALGDIVFASAVFLFQKGKEGDAGFEPDGDRCEIDEKLIATIMKNKKALIRRIQDIDTSRDHRKLEVFVKPMACSLSVINRANYFEENIASVDRQAVAVDMESFAVARACALSGNSKTKAIIVKSVMDKTVGKNDDAKAFASFTSALFCRLLIEEGLIS